MKKATYNVRDAQNASELPEKLRDMKLLGSRDGVLYLGAETGKDYWDSFIFSYSVGLNRVTRGITIKGGGFPTSSSVEGERLYVGTRMGNLCVIDLKEFRQIKKSTYNNSIDAICLNGSAYFGVNGVGLYKSSQDLSKPQLVKRDNVVSAIATGDRKLFVFYFSNGNDPILDGKPAGGVVEAFDSDLKTVRLNNSTPYAVTNARFVSDRVLFTTGDESNGWDEDGCGALYSLNPEKLEEKVVAQFPSSVHSLRVAGSDKAFVGLANGQVWEVSGRRSKPIFLGDFYIAGLELIGEDLFIGNPVGLLHKIKIK